MDIFLILTYIILNIAIVLYYISKKEDGAFAPPFIISAISLSVMLPQLTTIYFVNDYDNKLLHTLLYNDNLQSRFSVGF